MRRQPNKKPRKLSKLAMRTALLCLVLWLPPPETLTLPRRPIRATNRNQNEGAPKTDSACTTHGPLISIAEGESDTTNIDAKQASQESQTSTKDDKRMDHPPETEPYVSSPVFFESGTAKRRANQSVRKRKRPEEATEVATSKENLASEPSTSTDTSLSPIRRTTGSRHRGAAIIPPQESRKTKAVLVDEPEEPCLKKKNQNHPSEQP